jgi:hypothetical protein
VGGVTLAKCRDGAVCRELQGAKLAS